MNIMKNKLYKLSVMLFCAHNSYAANTVLTDIANFEKDPVEFFKTNAKKYTWINENAKNMLLQLPKWKTVKEKLVIEKNPKNQINLKEVKDKAKKFYANLLKDGEEYLKKAADGAIEEADFIWSEELIRGESTLVPVVQGLEDAPPYLRIMNTITGQRWYDPSETSGMAENIKRQFLEKKVINENLQDADNAKYKDAGYSVEITAEYIGEGKGEHSGRDEVKYKITRAKKIYDQQPDFNEIESNGRWMEVHDEKDIGESLEYEYESAVNLLLLDKYNDAYEYREFKDIEDQKKYEDWIQKIHNRFRDITKINKNFRVKVLYTSGTDAEFFLIHEVAHLLENVWLINNINKRKSSNLETFAVYVEMELDRCKTLRLYDMYTAIIDNCTADLMMRIVNLNDKEIRMQAIKKLMEVNVLKEYKGFSERFRRDVEWLDDPTYKCKEEYRTDLLKNIEQGIGQNDLSDHIKALYNAIQLRKYNMTLTQVLENLAKKEPAKLTPENFYELMNFLLK